MRTGRHLALSGLLLTMATCGCGLAQDHENEQAGQSLPVYTEEGTEACLFCHSGEKMQAVMAGAHGASQDKPTPMSLEGCESCHGPGSFHVSRAHGGRGFPRLTNFGDVENAAPRSAQVDACLTCHAEATGEAAIIEFTGSPHDIDGITCSTCHAVHVETDPIADGSHQLETCSNCHGDVAPDHEELLGESVDFEEISCSSCHDVHEAADGDE